MDFYNLNIATIVYIAIIWAEALIILFLFTLALQVLSQSLYLRCKYIIIRSIIKQVNNLYKL